MWSGKKIPVALFVLINSFVATGIFAAAAGGQSPTLYLEDSASTYHMSTGGAGLSSDVGQMWYNAAGLFPLVTGRNFSFSYQNQGADFPVNYLFMGYAWPATHSHKFSIGVSYLGNSSLESYDSSGQFEETYSTSEILGGFSHFWALNDYIYLSETLKVFYLNYEVASATMLAADFGVMVRPFDFLYVSSSIDNLISTNSKFAVESESLPVMFSVSPTVEFLDERARLHYKVSYAVPAFYDYNTAPEHRIGLDFDIYQKYISGRIGYDGQYITAGVGSKIKQYLFSAAYIPTAYESRWSATLSFDIDTVGAGPFRRPDTVPATDLEEELIDYYDGMRLYNQAKYKEAYDKFQKVVKNNPDHSLALEYRERALLHLKTQDWLDTEQEKLLKLHKELAQKYEDQANYGDAISEWRKVQELNPVDNEAEPNINRIKTLVRDKVMSYHTQGLSHYSQNKKIDAISSFSSALKLNPEYEPSKNWLFKIKQELSREELAEREKIERMQKAEVFYNRGLSLFGRKMYEESIQSFDQALALNPEHENAKRYRKMALEEWEAEKAGLRGIEAANTFYQKGMKAYGKENFYEAVNDFKKALRAYPAHQDSQKMLPIAEGRLEQQIKPYMIDGKAAYRKKQFSVAEEKFQAVLKLYPEYDEAKKYLNRIANERSAAISFHLDEGRKKFNRGQFSDSIYHFDEILKIDPNNSEAKSYLDRAKAKVKSRADQQHQLALKEFEAGNYDKAIVLWKKTLEIDPSYALAVKYIEEAENRRKRNKYDKAIDSWMKQGLALFQNRDYNRALTFFDKILDVDSKNTKALEYRQLCNEKLADEERQNKVAQLFIQGVRDYKRRKYDEAIDKWTKVKKLDPQNTLVDKYISQAKEAKKNRKIIDFINGEKYLKEGKLLLAKSSFERAIQEDPSNQKARNRLQYTLDLIQEEKDTLERSGDAKMRETKYEEAAADYMSAYRLVKNSDLFKKRENALKAQEYYEKGIEYFNSDKNIGLSIEPFMRVLELNPFDKRASDYIQQAKEKGKSRIDTWLQQAQAAENQGENQEAYSLYLSVKEIDPPNKTARLGISRTRKALREKASEPYKEGKEAMALKNYTLAIQKFQEVEKIYNNYEDTEKLLSEARDKLAAQRAAARAAAASGNNTGGSAGGSAQHLAIINSGIVAYRQGQYQKAINIWQRVPKSSAHYSKAQKYIARARLKM